MTPRPPTHREPNKAECQKMPPGSLCYDFEDDKWQYLEGVIGKEIETPQFFAVPITKQEAVTLHEPITREALNKALRERDEARAEARESLRDKFAMAALSGLVFHNDWGMRSDAEIANGAYGYADAMLAARNNQPEKV